MADPIFIELHLGAEALLALVRNRLRATAIPCTEAPLPGLGDNYLHHVEVPTASGFQNSNLANASGFVRRAPANSDVTIAHGSTDWFGQPTTYIDTVSVPDPQVVVPLRLHLTNNDRVEAGQDPITNDAFVLWLVFSLHAQVTRNETDQWGNPEPWTPTFAFTATTIDFGDLDGLLTAENKGLIQSQFSGQDVQMPVDIQPSLEQLLKGTLDLTVFNFGVSIDVGPDSNAHATQIVFRWEINGPTGSLGSWTTFLNGSVGPAPAGSKGFALRIQSSLLETWASALFAKKLGEELAKPSPKYEVLEWPSSEWSSGSLITTFDINILSASPCPNTIGVTITITTEFTLTADGQLQSTSTIEHSLYAGDIYLCSQLLSLPTDVGDPVGVIASSIAGGVIAEAYEVDMPEELGDLPEGCSWTNGNQAITCTFPLVLPLGDLQPITTGLGVSGGLQVLGGLGVKDFDAPEPWFNPTPTLVWSTGTYCDPLPPYVRLVLARAATSYICEVTVLDDLVGQFTSAVNFLNPVTGDPMSEVILSLGVDQIVGPPSIGNAKSWPPGSYFAAPYPCKVRIRMSNGSALVVTTNTLPSPPVEESTLPPVEEIHEAVEKKLNCQTFAEWMPEKIFRYRWLPDPAPDRPDSGIQEHLWRITIYSIDDDREIIVSDQDREIATLGSSTAGIAHAVLLHTPSPEGVTVRDRLGTGAMQRAGSIRVSQTLLSQVAEIPLQAPVKQVMLASMSPMVALCAGSGGLMVYSLANLSSPRTLQHVAASRVRGIARVSGTGILTWGQRGLSMRHRSTRMARCELTSTPILDVAVAGNWIFALTSKELEIYEVGGRFHGRVTCPTNARHVSATRSTLILATARRITVYDRAEVNRIHEVAQIDVPGIVDLVAADSADRQDCIVVCLAGGGSQQFDLSQPRQPRRVAVLAQDRWSTTAHLGNVVAAVSRNGMALGIYQRHPELHLNRQQMMGMLQDQRRMHRHDEKAC